jgi:hypothetical protein
MILIEKIRATKNPEAFQVQVSTTEEVENIGDNNVFGFLGTQEKKRMAWPTFHSSVLEKLGVDTSRQYTDENGQTFVNFEGFDLNAKMQEINGVKVKIQVIETLETPAFTREDGSIGVRSPKIMPANEKRPQPLVLCVDNQPIYRSTKLVQDKGQTDILLKHNSTMSLEEYQAYREELISSDELQVAVI